MGASGQSWRKSLFQVPLSVKKIAFLFIPNAAFLFRYEVDLHDFGSFFGIIFLFHVLHLTIYFLSFFRFSI